jgi:hypothetical protein
MAYETPLFSMTFSKSTPFKAYSKPPYTTAASGKLLLTISE